MKCITKRSIVQLAQVRVHVLVVLSILVLALLGCMPDSQGGWITCPPQGVMVAPRSRWHRQCGHLERGRIRRRATWWLHLSHTCYISLVRSLLLGVLWDLSGQVGPAWMRMVPWGVWLWQSGGVLWPWLRCQPEWHGIGWLLWQGQRWLMGGYLGLAMSALFEFHFCSPAPGTLEGSHDLWMLGLGCLVCGGEESWAEVGQEEDGSYTATLCGHFTLHRAGDHPFRVRLLMLFLRLLEVSTEQRGSRRTRDGRTSFVRQQYLAQVLGMPQPDISRMEKYWLEGDWANLLSLKLALSLTKGRPRC